MCKYCEELTPMNKMDAYGRKTRAFVKMDVSSSDIPVEDMENMCCIIPPTPISKRKHEHDGMSSMIEIYHSDNKRMVTHFYIPIRYCPFCGMEIK